MSCFFDGVCTVTAPPDAPSARSFGNEITPAGAVDVGPLRSPDGGVTGGGGAVVGGTVGGVSLCRSVAEGGPADWPDWSGVV